ncbi:hypothetical protein [Haladaptatus halobius]|uniref:hypothetical protein n=1 Tax=Haladaptatus halobius TaxID=2884875 RepID=UPI003F643729
MEPDTRSSPAVADGVVYVGCANGVSAVTVDGEGAWQSISRPTARTARTWTPPRRSPAVASSSARRTGGSEPSETERKTRADATARRTDSKPLRADGFQSSTFIKHTA